jgi:hypothetical protein
MQRRHREKVRDARRESAQIGKEIEERDKTLAAMAPLPRLLGEVAQIEASHTAIEAADVGRGNLSNFLDRLNSLRRQRDGRSARATAIGPLRPPPQYHETAPLEDLIEEMRHTGQRREFLLGRLKSLSVLRSPPAPHDTARLEIALKSMRAGIVRERRQAAIIAGLASLRSPPVPKEIAGLKSVCESMEKIGQRIKSIAAGADRLQKLATPPALTDVSRLLAHVRAIKAAAARRRRFHAKLTMLAPLSAPPETLVPLALQTATARHQQALEKSRRCSKRLAELDLQLQAVREQSRRWAEDHPQCPLCGATTDADLVLAGGHAHEH